MKRNNYTVRINKTTINAIIILIIMFISEDTYIFGTNSNASFVSASRYLPIGIVIFLLFKIRFKFNISANKRKIKAYIVMVISFGIICFVNHDNINRISLKFLWITISFLLCIMLSFNDFAESYIKAICFVSVSAIVFTGLAYISPSIIRRFPAIINTSNAKIYTCGFAGLFDGVLDRSAIRTQGIFWEPGVFQMYINLAIALELLYKRRINKKHLYTLIIALLLTFSTTGYIAFAWLVTVYFFVIKSRHKEDISKRFIIIILFFIAAIILFQFSSIGDMIFGKIYDRTNDNYGSTTVRLAGILVSLKIALSNPIHGIGMSMMKDEFLDVSILLRDILGGWTDDNTNTILYQFAAYGIPYGLFFTIGTFKFGNYFANGRKIITITILIMMFILYVGENLQYSFFPYIIVLYGYGWRRDNLFSKSEVLQQI